MKAFKIDVIKQEVYEIDIPKGVDALHRELECRVFTVAYPEGVPEGFTLYVDDEGFIKGKPLGFFLINGYPQVLSGHGIIVGTDGEGDSADAPGTLEELQQNVHFGDYNMAQQVLRVMGNRGRKNTYLT